MIPAYTPAHYASLTDTLDPIETYQGFSVKRGDAFQLGPLTGSKVRQCLHVVHTHLDEIRDRYHGGLLTAAGLPSPQTAIVCGVATYFGLHSAIAVPRYKNETVDVNRLNVSLSQHFGARVFGATNPRPSGVEHLARSLDAALGYYRIKFGMIGDVAMEPVVQQVANVPDAIREVVIISGSGLSALSVLKGLARYQKHHVEQVTVVTLSHFFHDNKRRWYDEQPEQFAGRLHIVESPLSYGTLYKKTEFDWTYEAKAWRWMTDHRTPDPSILFWVVGKRVYDMQYHAPIQWQTLPTSTAYPDNPLF